MMTKIINKIKENKDLLIFAVIIVGINIFLWTGIEELNKANTKNYDLESCINKQEIKIEELEQERNELQELIKDLKKEVKSVKSESELKDRVIEEKRQEIKDKQNYINYLYDELRDREK